MRVPLRACTVRDGKFQYVRASTELPFACGYLHRASHALLPGGGEEVRACLQMHIARPHAGRSRAFRRSLEDSFSGTPNVGTLATRLRRARVRATVSPRVLAKSRRQGVLRPRTCGVFAVLNRVSSSCSRCGAKVSQPPHAANGNARGGPALLAKTSRSPP